MDNMRNPLGLAALALFLAAGCHEQLAEEEVLRSLDTDGTPHITVKTFNGSICVVTRIDPEVRIKVTKLAGGEDEDESQELLDQVGLTIEQDGDNIFITAETLEGARSNEHAFLGATVNLQVPEGSALDLKTDNAAVCVTGTRGSVVAETTNGTIEAKDSSGTLDLTTTNGGIKVEALDAVVVASTTNGGIDVVGTLAAGLHAFETTNGAISVTLPQDAQFTLDADTTNGAINSEFTFSDVTERDDDALKGSVGDNPDFTLLLKTTNGSIRVKQAE